MTHSERSPAEIRQHKAIRQRQGLRRCRQRRRRRSPLLVGPSWTGRGERLLPTPLPALLLRRTGAWTRLGHSHSRPLSPAFSQSIPFCCVELPPCMPSSSASRSTRFSFPSSSPAGPSTSEFHGGCGLSTWSWLLPSGPTIPRRSRPRYSAEGVGTWCRSGRRWSTHRAGVAGVLVTATLTANCAQG